MDTEFLSTTLVVMARVADIYFTFLQVTFKASFSIKSGRKPGTCNPHFHQQKKLYHGGASVRSRMYHLAQCRTCCVWLSDSHHCLPHLLHIVVVEHGCFVCYPAAHTITTITTKHSSSWYALGPCLTGTISLGLSVAGSLWCRTFAVELAHTVPVSPSGSIPQFETGIFLYRATEFLVTDNSMGLTIVPDPGGVE